ncbi:MAG: hypothetical protein SWO11_06595 [Thermodesulfobacteriota bacterium]|nr:hypothetical protein [Thermodesulfobacteriota bacterium]
MKRSFKGLFVIMMIIMSFFAVQSVYAQTVSGTIDSITTDRPVKIVVDGIEVSGIRLNYLCNQYNICLEVGDTVSVEYYEFECLNGSIILKACGITVGGATISLRPCL